jgi:hypothetical protein
MTLRLKGRPRPRSTQAKRRPRMTRSRESFRSLAPEEWKQKQRFLGRRKAVTRFERGEKGKRKKEKGKRKKEQGDRRKDYSRSSLRKERVIGSFDGSFTITIRGPILYGQSLDARCKNRRVLVPNVWELVRQRTVCHIEQWDPMFVNIRFQLRTPRLRVSLPLHDQTVRWMADVSMSCGICDCARFPIYTSATL